MFGFGKRKKNRTLTASFGTVDAFKEAYVKGDPDFLFGSDKNVPIGVSLNGFFHNKMTIINDDKDSIRNNCIIPMLSSRNLSYVLYDPDGEYFNATSAKLRSLGYDVAQLDFADETHASRINPFEMVNVTKNAYWNALIFAGSIKCTQAEVRVAHNIFMAMMQYILATGKNVDISNLHEIFNAIKETKASVIRDIMSCPSSAKYLKMFEDETIEVRSIVFAKIDKYFFNLFMPKVTNPNVFAITTSNRKTAIFVKPVPKKYQSLMTTFLFNMKTASVLHGESSANAVLFDFDDHIWYNKPLLNKICDDAGSIIERGVLSINITSALKNGIPDGQLVVYMHSSDDETIKNVRDRLMIKNVSSEEELYEIKMKNKYFKKHGIPESELCKAPVSENDMRDLKGCIVVDTAKKIQPFTCDLLI